MVDIQNLNDLINIGEELLNKYPDDVTLKVGLDVLKLHRRQVKSECTYNHWTIANREEHGKFCPFCGLDISYFKLISWLSKEYHIEEERAFEARR